MLVTDRNWVQASWVVEFPGVDTTINLYIVYPSVLGIFVGSLGLGFGIALNMQPLLAGVDPFRRKSRIWHDSHPKLVFSL
jgi:hypothetical protein